MISRTGVACQRSIGMSFQKKELLREGGAMPKRLDPRAKSSTLEQNREVLPRIAPRLSFMSVWHSLRRVMNHSDGEERERQREGKESQWAFY